jgi:Family of unknown function (DUF6263)
MSAAKVLFCQLIKLLSMKKIILLAAITILMMAVTSLQSCENADGPGGSIFKFNLETDKQYDYEIIWDMDQKMMDKESKINLLAGYSFEVTDEKDKIKTLRGVYSNFRLYMKIMDMEMDIDTEKPVDNVSGEDPMTLMKKLFSGIKGKTFTMKVDEEGNVLSVTGFEEIINGMVDSAGVDEDMKLQMRVSLKDQFNEQELKNQFAQAFMIFPNKSVKVGDSWQKKFKMGGKMPASYSTTYTVKKMENEQITLDAKTTITSAEGEMEVKGEQTGILLVNSKTGLVVNAEFTQEMETKTQDFQIKINGKGKIRGKER